MFELIQSNRAAVLADVFCERNGEPGDPFVPLSVVVQNHGQAQWLKQRLAVAHGVAANVSCEFLAAFLWRLCRRLPNAAPGESPFDPARLSWRLMKLLEQGEVQDPQLQNYLEQPGDADLRRYQLGDEIARLFDRYLSYRPEWAAAWAAGRNEPKESSQRWQPALWRALLQDLGEEDAARHRAAQQGLLMEQLKSGAYPQDALPPRLSVFGLSAMPPAQLQALEALAERIDVDLYFLNPCRDYWGDIVSKKKQARRADRVATPQEQYLEEGNPLLAYLGEQGQEFFEMLLETPTLRSQEHFREHDADTALGMVKNDILDLTAGAAADAPAPAPPPEQDSLQLHSCHSPLREVEATYDVLLRLMDQKKDLRPWEILVAAPNIAAYLPFIRSVFGESLPFAVVGRNAAAGSPLGGAFLDLLQLPESRLTAADVMGMLDVPAVARRCGITPDRLPQLARWVRDAGIRWELDGAHKAQHWQVPPQPGNTWEFGMDRLLLGFAMTEERPWQGLLPCETAPDEAPLLAALAHFIERLGRLRRELTKKRSPQDWRTLLYQLLADFFTADESEDPELERLRGFADALAAAAAAGGYEQDVSAALVHYWMQRQLATAGERGNPSAGGVRVADLAAARGVPYRVVCLLGMNDGEFPQKEHFHSFDLLSPRNGIRRPGDWSSRQDDRQLFLESLLAAGEAFCLSYVGQGLRDNQEKPPSMLAAEWLRCLQARFDADGIRPQVHALQPFNRRYHGDDPRQSFQALWRPDGAAPAAEPEFCPEPLAADSAPPCRSLDQLERFFCNAAQFFLTQRLGVYFSEEDAVFQDTEPFSLDALETYQLADDALDWLLHGGDEEEWAQRQRAAGRALPGAAGELLLQEPLRRARELHKALGETLELEHQPRSGIIPLTGAELQYRVEQVYGDIHTYYHAGKLKGKRLVTAWLRHLALNAAHGDLLTKVVGLDEKSNNVIDFRFRALDAGTCRQYLGRLLELSRLGLTRPLLLPPDASKQWYEAWTTKSNRHAAAEAAAKAWDGWSGFGESADRHWARLFELPERLREQSQLEEFARHAFILWHPLLENNMDRKTPIPGILSLEDEQLAKKLAAETGYSPHDGIMHP